MQPTERSIIRREADAGVNAFAAAPGGQPGQLPKPWRRSPNLLYGGFPNPRWGLDIFRCAGMLSEFLPEGDLKIAHPFKGGFQNRD